MESRSATALFERWYLAIVVRSFQLFQVFFRIEVLTYATINAFLDGRSKECDSPFVIFQATKARPNHFAGVVIPAHLDAVSDELLVMRAYGCGYCPAHDVMDYVAKVRIFLITTNTKIEKIAHFAVPIQLFPILAACFDEGIEIPQLSTGRLQIRRTANLIFEF